MTRDHVAERVEGNRKRYASLALWAGVLNWIAWAAVIGAAMISETVLILALFFGIFFAGGSFILGCLGLVAGFGGVRSVEARMRRKAWTGIALLLLLGPALWAAATFGYGSQEWTEEVKLANGDTVLLHRHVRNGPDEFAQKCSACISMATYSGEYRGHRFEWSTDRSTVKGSGPIVLEFSDDAPVLVFRVTGKKECGSRGWPNPPLRVIRFERRALLPDRWIDSTLGAVPENARVNLSGLHHVPRFGSGERLVTIRHKDFEEGDRYGNLAPHGAKLAVVGELLKADPDSCNFEGRSRTR